VTILAILMPLALLLSFSFTAVYFWSVWRGQYDDLETPAHRILLEDEQEGKIS